MPFKNQRNSRDDNSRKQRSNSESFKSKGGAGRKTANPKAENFSKSTFSKDKKDEKTPFGKSAFGKNRFEGGKSYSKNSFSKSRSGDEKYTDKASFSKDRSDNKKSFGKSSRFSRSDSPAFERPKDGEFKENRNFKTGRKRTFSDEYKEQKENNDFKYTAKQKFSPAHKPANREAEDDGLIRLNRYISNSGICSRRKADELITAGVISVNGEVVTELGTKVDPAKDEIRYNNERLKREKMVYVLLNKPKDYITTTDDPQERRTVMHLIAKATKERIYPVGRLDRNTTGLLLMTNDGNLADKLSHPKNNVTKIYQIELNKNLTQGDFNKIEFGLELEDGFIKPDDLSYVQGASKREVGIQIHSGKNRIVRRIFESLGYEVVKLDRVVYANLTKKDLPRGRWRYLEERELVQLKHLIK